MSETLSRLQKSGSLGTRYLPLLNRVPALQELSAEKRRRVVGVLQPCTFAEGEVTESVKALAGTIQIITYSSFTLLIVPVTQECSG